MKLDKSLLRLPLNEELFDALMIFTVFIWLGERPSNRAKLFTSDLCNVSKLSGLLMKPDSLPCKVSSNFLVKILNWHFSANFQVEILAKIYAKILLSQNFSATKILWMSYQLLWRVSIVLLHVAARNSPYCQFWLKILAKFPCWKF